MLRRSIRDESGVAMGLTVIMVLLIGVMGAGLLAFVRSDLASVIEENKGQKALDIADAGVQAAKSHLRVDSFREHYDTNRANDCAEGPRVGSENWSKATNIYTAANGACTGPSTRTDNAATPWREDQGVSRLFGGGRFHVTIECYIQIGDTGSPCDGGATGSAPENVAAAEKKFFKIISTGYDTASGDGAIRRIEAIYTTARRTYVPVAYWTPNNIFLTGGGSTTVSKMSFFAGKNIQGVTGTSAGTTIADRNTAAIYGDWNVGAPYNTTPRRDTRTNPATAVTGAGFGAGGFVCGSMNQACNATNTSNLVANGYHDYDSTTGTKGQGKQFVRSAPPASTEITFPFDARNTLGPAGNPADIVDPALVEEMRRAAQAQGYVDTTGGALTTWPSTGEITYFVDGANFTYKANNGQGIIVVRNGNFDFGSNSYFKGVIIVIGNGATTGAYQNAGNGVLDGYVAASGDITIKGNVSPSLSLQEITLLNNFYDVKLWSWRELY